MVATGRTSYTPDRNGVLHQEPKNLIYIALYYSNNFNSTAPFKNAILVPDLAGRLFGDDFVQLIPCKMDRPYVPHSYVSLGPYLVVATGRTRYTPGTIKH